MGKCPQATATGYPTLPLAADEAEKCKTLSEQLAFPPSSKQPTHAGQSHNSPLSWRLILLTKLITVNINSYPGPLPGHGCF